MAEIFRLETRGGRGAFQVLDEQLIKIAPQVMEIVPDKDPGLNKFMDDVLERQKNWSFKDDVTHLFKRANNPQYYRDQPHEWFFGFANYKQLREVFPDDDALKFMQKKSILLRVYDVPEEDIYYARQQVLFLAKNAEKTGNRDLLTGGALPETRMDKIQIPFLYSRQPSI